MSNVQYTTLISQSYFHVNFAKNHTVMFEINAQHLIMFMSKTSLTVYIKAVKSVSWCQSGDVEIAQSFLYINSR